MVIPPDYTSLIKTKIEGKAALSCKKQPTPRATKYEPMKAVEPMTAGSKKHHPSTKKMRAMRMEEVQKSHVSPYMYNHDSLMSMPSMKPPHADKIAPPNLTSLVHKKPTSAPSKTEQARTTQKIQSALLSLRNVL